LVTGNEEDYPSTLANAAEFGGSPDTSLAVGLRVVGYDGFIWDLAHISGWMRARGAWWFSPVWVIGQFVP
jgi:hypothetical protein